MPRSMESQRVRQNLATEQQPGQTGMSAVVQAGRSAQSLSHVRLSAAPGSSVHGTFQSRILEQYFPISYSRGSS